MTSPASPGSHARYPRVILGTCPVPWTCARECDEAMFRRSIRHAVATLTPRLYIFGTAGEGYAVTDRQYREIVTVFADEMKRNAAIPMVGVISISLGTMIERIEFGHARGVREFQISFPAWGALTDEEVDRFFAEICGRFPDARFLHYNLARARRVLAGADYARLAPRHANLAAIKMGGQDTKALHDVAAAAPQIRCFFTEFGYIALRDATDCGLLCALGVAEPALAKRLFAAAAGERAALEPVFRDLHRAAVSALQARASCMDGAYDKMFLKRQIPDFPLALLPPYSGASEAEFAAFQASCDAALAASAPAPVS